ncbi:hypothetical protein ACH4S9_29890 [Streptomyces sp. NPDC021225]|uniref:hypothetical protein n=1 Tax=Streptomyces sp. NPDC021225 TaxID=3365121 RepID=UPI00379337EB
MTTYTIGTLGRRPHRSEPPAGRYPVGAIFLHLVDRDRCDAWVPSRPYRELMVGVRYPAREVEGYERVPGSFAHEDAPPVLDPVGPRPVVLYSPGVGEARVPGTPLVDELASHGYVVVFIDHADDAPAAKFPHDRVADVRFVLDQLASLAPGLLDLSRIGLCGRSEGRLADLGTLYDDPRIKAVADLDGEGDGDGAAARLVAFFDRRLLGREEIPAATAARAGR